MIGPLIDAEDMAAFRADAESLHVDTFTAYEPAGYGPLDPLTGEKPRLFSTRATGVKGKVKGLGGVAGSDQEARFVTIGGVRYQVMPAGLHLSVSALVPSPGWEYECTAVGASSDPSLLGRRYRAIEVPAKTWATARRLDVIEV
jgi:hypothetical protein